MTYQSYELSRYIGDDTNQSTSFTVADDDPINCAHMLAAGFNTLSRNTLNGFVLAVVDTDSGSVQYDGKIERLVRIDDQTVSTSFKSEASTDAAVFVLRSIIQARDEEIAALVQERANNDERDRLGGVLYRHAGTAEARAELIEYVKRERAKWKAADDRAPVNHEHMRAWFRGMLDVLAKFLVVTGEADASEGHAVARRLCEVPDGKV